MPQRPSHPLSPAAEDRLNAYRRRSNAATKMAPARGTKSWGAYAAATGAAMAGAHTAEAAIVHVTPADPLRAVAATTNASQSRNLALDIDFDGAIDLNLFVGTYSAQTPFTSNGTPYVFDGDIGVALGSGPGVMAGWQIAPGNMGSNLAQMLSSGSNISAGQSFNANALLASFAVGDIQTSNGSSVSASVGFGYGEFPVGGTGVAGFRFQKEGATHYGWIRVRIEANEKGLPAVVEALEWAYEDEAGKAIRAGLVPEPAGLALLAAGAAGVAALRRRQA
ncbi:PEP-CTERM sorting domain-containing protein [Botrimarina hoheduenensis]|uniref:PEP-CTERM motif protein n=1 Tax=Botrimarina hoheduenensis TaxID=2528000 RepID=A0A5C5VY74_9BACT|nr:PEP-CTERM sorting domain-containing protein [Botrimarina hoheduenensis]TWT42679.1 PEP-CTERM motif protein [Botrimarina hoheduenensis]